MSELAVCDEIKCEAWQARPAPLSHIEFAYTLTVPDSEDDHGRLDVYDPRSHQGQFVFLSALDGAYDRPGRRFQTFVLIGDAQGSGKSWLLQQIAFHDMVERGQNVIYALPTRDLGGDIWSLKLSKAITGAGLEKYLPTQGSGSKNGSRPRFVPFSRIGGKGGGTLIFMAAGGRGQSGQAALTARKLLVDEVEDWQPEPLQLIRKRLGRNNATALQIYACTINKNNNPFKEDDESRIIPFYEQSTRGRLEYPCVHCGQLTRFDLDCFRYDGTAPDEWAISARLFCRKCDAAINETQRLSMLSGGELVMDQPNGLSFGLKLKCWDCPWKSLLFLATEHYNAKLAIDRGSHEPMRQFYNKEESEQYSADYEEMESGATLTWQELHRRSAASAWGPSRHITDRTAEGSEYTYSRHICDPPNEANFAVAFVDVQNNRVYWVITAADSNGTAWDIAWGYEYARSDKSPWQRSELFALLDRVHAILPGYSGSLTLESIGLDTGDFTDELYRWLSGRRGGGIWKACKGLSTSIKPLPLDIEGIIYPREGLYLIDGDNTRDAVHAAFRRPINTPGAAMLPHGLTTNASDRAYMMHLIGEMSVIDNKTRKTRIVKRGRWDWLDCRRGNEALVRLHLRGTRPKRKMRYGVIGEISS